MIRQVPALAMLLASAPAAAGLDPPAWTRPIAPFAVIGPITYVGTEGLAAYLIRTPRGAILLDGTMAENVPAIERNIIAAGVPLRAVRWLLNSHAHFDHAAGLAQLKRDTGARVAAMAPDVAALESGTPPSDTSYGIVTFPGVKVDRVLRNGDRIVLGGVTLTAFLTPGHTPGCTTWATTVAAASRRLRVVFPCSMSVAGNRLVGNRGYPGIVADFRLGFSRLRAMRADVALTAHPEIADVLRRRDRARAGEQDAFVDRALLPRLVASASSAFDTEFARQRQLANGSGTHRPPES